MLTPQAERRAMAAVSQRLAEAYPGIAPDMVRDVVAALHAHFANRPSRDQIPVMVERMAAAWLAENAPFMQNDTSVRV